MRRALLVLGLVALGTLVSDQALIETATGRENGDRWQTRLRLFASQPTPHREPSRNGALKVAIPSFGHVGRPGDVYLPTKTIRIAIPENDGGVRLDSWRGKSQPVAGVRLAAPSTETGRIGSRPTALPADPAGAGDEPGDQDVLDFVPPALPVRLGDIGYLRDQKFIEVIFTPVVSPQGGGEAVFYGDLEVDLTVEGVDAGAVSEQAAAEDPLFEDVYKAGLANYEDGRYLRTRRGWSGLGPLPNGASTRTSRTSSSSTAAGAETESVFGLSGAQIQSGFPAYKLGVSKNGIYRLSQAYLIDPTTGVAKLLAGADPRQFKIMNRGVEIPIHVEGETDGVFDPGDFIEFYGQKLDGPETILNYDFGLLPSVYQYDDYTDRNIYWLSVDSSLPRSRMPVRNAPPDGGYPLAADFGESLRLEVDNLYQPSGGDDPFLAGPRLRENTGTTNPATCAYTNPGIPSVTNGKYLKYDPADTTRHCPTCRMTLPGINAASASQATLKVRLRGTTVDPNNASPDHMSVVEVGGVPSRSSVLCWTGLTFVEQSVSFAQSALTSPLDIRIEQPGLSPNDSTNAPEELLVDWTEVQYRRLFQAINDGLKFTVPDQNTMLAVSGLSTNNATNVVVYEITDSIAPVLALGGGSIVTPVRVTGGTFSGSAGNFTYTFDNDLDPVASSRIYTVAGPGTEGLLLPDSVVQDTPSTLLDATNEADVIVLGAPLVMDMTPGSPFVNYWNHRSAVDGYVVKIVDVNEVFDEFGFGIPHPEAMRSFLAYAYDTWKGPALDPNRAPLSFVTIVGDTTADPRNLLNRSDWNNVVPAFIMYQLSSVLGFYSSDNYIASFRGTDQLADVHLGRLPVHSATEAVNVFTKLLAYDTASPTGSWRGHGVFMADEGKAPGESGEFERITDDVINLFWQPQPPHSVTKLYYDDPNFLNGNDPDAMYQAIIDAHNAGTVLMQYTGHGSFAIWGVDGYFFSSDANSLAANGKYSFQINENCLSGGFHFLAGDALSEAFVKAPNRGSVAFLAPAGLSFAFIGETINHQVYGDMFGPRRERRFGPMITKVRVSLGSINSLLDQQSYTLIGDPTQEFILPNPNPPGSLTATGGNAHVDLAWTPSPDPNTRTVLYRSTSPNGTYTKITPTPITGTAYIDPNLPNATLFYYQAAAVDASGFEGKRTNFNSDCVPLNPPASGPDCVWAKPVNTTPPQTPTGTNVYSDGSGVRLQVVWNANPENDIGMYVVKYGTVQGGPYNFTVVADPNSTSISIPGLSSSSTYYVRVSAKNTSGYESLPSPELVGRPSVFTGENPPKMITDLRVARTVGDPNSITLSWTKPAVDIYGGPTTVASYQIYRGNVPNFVPSLSNRIAVIMNPNQTTYTDPGAWVFPSSLYYLVTSTDTRGYTSGASHELPQGVLDLALEVLPGETMIRFTWNGVFTDVHGEVTLVEKYVLYASSSPITRSMTDTMTPILDDITATTVDLPINPSHKFYTLIVVDTRGNKSPF